LLEFTQTNPGMPTVKLKPLKPGTNYTKSCPEPELESWHQNRVGTGKLANSHSHSQASSYTTAAHSTRPSTRSKDKSKQSRGGEVGREGYYDLVGAEDAELHELDLGHLSRRVREPRVHLGCTRRRRRRPPPPPRVSDRCALRRPATGAPRHEGSAPLAASS